MNKDDKEELLRLAGIVGSNVSTASTKEPAKMDIEHLEQMKALLQNKIISEEAFKREMLGEWEPEMSDDFNNAMNAANPNGEHLKENWSKKKRSDNVNIEDLKNEFENDGVRKTSSLGKKFKGKKKENADWITKEAADPNEALTRYVLIKGCPVDKDKTYRLKVVEGHGSTRTLVTTEALIYDEEILSEDVIVSIDRRRKDFPLKLTIAIVDGADTFERWGEFSDADRMRAAVDLSKPGRSIQNTDGEMVRDTQPVIKEFLDAIAARKPEPVSPHSHTNINVVDGDTVVVSPLIGDGIMASTMDTAITASLSVDEDYIKELVEERATDIAKNIVAKAVTDMKMQIESDIRSGLIENTMWEQVDVKRAGSEQGMSESEVQESLKRVLLEYRYHKPEPLINLDNICSMNGWSHVEVEQMLKKLFEDGLVRMRNEET